MKTDEAAKWALGVSICALTSCIVEMLISDTRLEKNVRRVLGMFMLCVVLIPLCGVINDISTELPAVEFTLETDLPDKVSEMRIDYLKRCTADLIEKKLKEHDISPLKVSVNTDIDDDLSINMITAEVTLSGKDSHKAADAALLIKNELGISCKTLIVK